jgi:hypothetical protein
VALNVADAPPERAFQLRALRVTYDVDVVAEVVTLASYEAFQTELRNIGFAEDIESGVICRWRHAAVSAHP